MGFCGISLSQVKWDSIYLVWTPHLVLFSQNDSVICWRWAEPFFISSSILAFKGENFTSASFYKLCNEKLFKMYISHANSFVLFFGLSSVKHFFISTINSLDENKHSYALTEVLPKFRYKGISEILLKRTLPITKLSLPISEIEA